MRYMYTIKKCVNFVRHRNFSGKANSAHNLLFKTRSFNFKKKKKKNMRKVTSVTEKNFNNLNFPILYSTTIYLSIYLSDKNF